MKENNKNIIVCDKILNEEKNMNNKKYGFKKYKKLAKKLIIIGVIAIISILGVSGGVAYKIINGNMNYSEEYSKELALDKVATVENYNKDESKEIALSKVKGEVVKVEKDIDDDTMSVIYEFKIKGTDNMLYEVDVDSKTGAIVEFEEPSLNR